MASYRYEWVESVCEWGDIPQVIVYGQKDRAGSIRLLRLYKGKGKRTECRAIEVLAC